MRILCVRVCVRHSVWHFPQKNTENEFLKHSKESRGVLGQAGKQAGQASRELKRRSSRRGNVCVCLLRMPLKEFLKHSKESRGVLMQERAQERTSKQSSKQAPRRHSVRASVGACSLMVPPLFHSKAK